jgi:hypothetical protein
VETVAAQSGEGQRHTLLMGLLGSAVFGLALRIGAEQRLGVGHGLWALALALTALSAWGMCLPATYILWASRRPQCTAQVCLVAASAALGVLGQTLAASAPILAFFAVTAPESSAVPGLGIALTGLALLASAAVFTRRIAESAGSPALVGVPDPPRSPGSQDSSGSSIGSSPAAPGAWAQLGIFALLVATFVQVAHALGVRWS